MVMAIESHMVHRLTIITLQKYSVMGLSRLALIPRWRSFCFSAFFLAPVFFFGILYQVKFSYVFSFIWTKSWPTRLRCNKLPGDSKGECEVWGWIKKPLTENRNKKGYNLVPSLLAFWSGHEIGQKKWGCFCCSFWWFSIRTSWGFGFAHVNGSRIWISPGIFSEWNL